MSKADKFKLETDGWWDAGEDYYDPGYRLLELWKLDGESWKQVWESSAVDGDEIGDEIIKAELLEILPRFGLTPEDIIDFDSNCIYDWEIR